MSQRQHAERRPPWVVGALVFSGALGCAAFLPALNNEFVYDDLPIIVNNATVTRDGPWYRFWRVPWWPRGTSNDRLYRPLTLWSFRANIVVADALGAGDVAGLPADKAGAALDPFWFHAVNLALHGLTSAGVALLAYRLSGRTAAAWIAGVLFATHPIHTEAVVTGYGRAELLAGFFAVWLLARYCAMNAREVPVTGALEGGSAERSAEQAGKPPMCRGRGLVFHAVNGALLLAAMMSKEHAVFVWPVLMLADLWRRRMQTPRMAWRDWLNRTAGPAHLAFALAAAGFFLLRFSVFTWKSRIHGSELPYWQAPMGHASLIEHVLTPFRLAWLTLELLVWPPRLCPIWSVPALPLADALSADVIGGMVIIAVVIFASIWLWRRGSPAGPVGLGLLVLLALPLQAVPVANWLFAERWLYLPTVLIAALLGMAAARTGRAGVLAAVGLAIALTPGSWAYSAAFHDGLTMLRTVVRRQPDNLQGHKNLTGAMLVIGDYAAAVQIGRETIARFGDIPEVHLHMARAYLELGDGSAALRALDDYLRSSAGEPGLSYGTLRSAAQELIEKEDTTRPARPSTRNADGGP